MSSSAELNSSACPRGPGLLSGCEPEAGADSCRVVQDLSLLLEICQTMESSLQVRDLVRPTLRKLSESIGMTRGAISLLDRETGQPAVEEVVGLARHESPSDY